jgi:DNA-binding response OmpR family regulator
MSYTILLVDDDNDLRSLMAVILKRAGYEVYQASDGPEALDLVNTMVPDLFIIDVMMPEMSGFEVCLHLRANPKTASRPLFLLSARADRTSREAGRDCGADRYLVKPIGTDELIANIEDALKQRDTV